MNILIASHAPWRNTGYGAPVHTLVQMFKGLGHNVAVMAVDHEEKAGIIQTPFVSTIIPPKGDKWGLETIDLYCRYLQVDIILSFFDPWVLREPYKVEGVEWWAWFPVDQDPPPYGLREITTHADKSFSFSDYGAEVMGIKSMPIPVSDTYFDVMQVSKSAARSALQFPQDEKLILFNGTFLGGDRKALRQSLEGYSLYKNSGGEGKLILNTDMTSELSGLIGSRGLEGKVLVIPPFTRIYMLAQESVHALLLRAMDVILHPSAAEGFGLVLAEAAAAGVPVIGAKNTSQPQVIGKNGIMVEDLTEETAPQGGKWYRPTPEGICDALHQDLDMIPDGTRFTIERCAELWSKEF